MLSSILRRRKKEFLEHVNCVWDGYDTVNAKEFNQPIGNGENKGTVIKFISQLSEKMYNERLAAQVDEKGNIIGWQFWDESTVNKTNED
jgi:hypothetical protein